MLNGRRKFCSSTQQVREMRVDTGRGPSGLRRRSRKGFVVRRECRALVDQTLRKIRSGTTPDRGGARA